MNPADNEINLFLPFVFAVLVLIFALTFGGIFLFLRSKKASELTNQNQFFSVLRAAVLSIVGVFVITGLVGVSIFTIQLLKSFFE